MKPHDLIQMTRQCLPVLLIISLLLSGCTTGGMVDPFEAREKRESAQRKEGAHQPGMSEAGRDLMAPTLNSISNRIHANEQKLAEWHQIQQKLSTATVPQHKSDKMYECMQQLEDILSGYRSLHSRLLQETRFDAAQLLAGESLLQLNQQDVDYLEGGCGRLLADLQTTPPEPQQHAVTADTQINEAFTNEEYDRVITLYTQMPLEPGQFPAAETVFQYGQALVKNHQEASALTVFDDLLRRIRQQGQNELELQVLRSIADLQFALGAHDQARGRYEELILLSTERGQADELAVQHLAALQPGSLRPEELRDYSVLFKNFQAYLPKRDNYALVEQADAFLGTYPGSRMQANVEAIRKSCREQADAWLNKGIQRIESLANERKAIEGPDGARPTGQDLSPGSALPPSGPQPMDSEQGTSGSTPQISEAEQKVLQEDYDKGMALLTAKEYEKSIEQFAKLLQTSYADKARAQIDEAAKLAAQQDREKAASLFVRANSTRDPESKKKLLLSSQQLLQAILIKYPQSGLTDKVQRNLSNVERELNAVAGSIKKAGEADANTDSMATPAPGSVPGDLQPVTPN